MSNNSPSSTQKVPPADIGDDPTPTPESAEALSLSDSASSTSLQTPKTPVRSFRSVQRALGSLKLDMTIFKRGRVNSGNPSLAIPQRSNKKKSHSKSPAIEPSSPESILPNFLCQHEQEQALKFRGLENKQRERLEDPALTGRNSPWVLNTSPEALSRNRYVNIAPYDKNRVHLDVLPGVCDYINASPIVLERTSTRTFKNYIATQGPKEAQAAHFWRMVFERTGDVGVVVMLTRPRELNREKCFEYYPPHPGTMMYRAYEDFGEEYEIDVELLDVVLDEVSRTEMRKILLTVKYDLPRRSSTGHRRVAKSKTVWHLFFKGWPDWNAPEGEEKKALLELIKLANTKNGGDPSNPLIVHCSAGVGRSGTFIALDHLLTELRDGSLDNTVEDPIFDTVDHLREQRMHMVQSESQYQFIYEVLKEKYLAREYRRSSRSMERGRNRDRSRSTHRNSFGSSAAERRMSVGRRP